MWDAYYTKPCCADWFCDRSWLFDRTVGRVVSNRNAVASATPSITVQSQLPLLMGPGRVSFDDATDIVMVQANGMSINGMPFNRSNSSFPAKIFWPQAAQGLAPSQFLGCVLPVGSQFQMNMATVAGGAKNVDFLSFCRPLSGTEWLDFQNRREPPPGQDMIFGLGSATIAAGATVTLTGTALRPVFPGEGLGLLVIDFDPALPNDALLVQELAIAGIKVDAETGVGEYSARNHSPEANFSRGYGFDNMLMASQSVTLTLRNTTAAPIIVGAGFIRDPAAGTPLDGSRTGGGLVFNRPVASDPLGGLQGGAGLDVGTEGSGGLSVTGRGPLGGRGGGLSLPNGSGSTTGALSLPGDSDPAYQAEVKAIGRQIREGRMSPDQGRGRIRQLLQRRIGTGARATQGGSGRR